MKRMALCCILAVFCLSLGSALWALDNDVKEIPSCKYCGMNRETFAHSRMLIEYNDGTKEGTCSLHCAAVDLALNLDKTPKAIQVGDYGTKGLINAETAVWVIGGSKPGVMTKNAKWAFANKADAEKFQQENGGRIATIRRGPRSRLQGSCRRHQDDPGAEKDAKNENDGAETMKRATGLRSRCLLILSALCLLGFLLAVSPWARPK